MAKNDKFQWPTSNLRLPESNAYEEKGKSVISAVTIENKINFFKFLVVFFKLLKTLVKSNMGFKILLFSIQITKCKQTMGY